MFQLLSLLCRKRFVATILAIVMVLTMVPLSAFAEVSGALSDPNIELSDNGGTWSANGTTVSGSATGTAETCSSSAGSGTLTIKNKSGVTKTLSFHYALELNGGTVNIAGTSVTADGDFSRELSANGSITVSITTQKGNYTTKVTLTEIALIKEGNVSVTFEECINGSYTVDGETITEDTTISKPSTEPFVLSATPESGFKFGYWQNTISGKALSLEANCSLKVDEDIRIAPVFLDQSDPFFSVGGAVFTDLSEAVSYANSNNQSVITLISSGTLPAKEAGYNIPEGKTLLIPYNEEYSLVTNDNLADHRVASASTPSAFRTLTLADGVSITVSGNISLASGVHQSSTGQTGPYGCIYLNPQAQIVFENGSRFYAFGYAKGTGKIELKSGATVYENLFIADYPGSASSTSSIVNAGAFPFSKFSVRNVEAPMTLLSGAIEEVYCNVYGTNVGYIDTWVDFIGTTSSSALFRTSGSLTKAYVSGRQKITTNGTASINDMSISVGTTVSTSSLSGVIIPYNYDLTLASGTVTINANMILSKGTVTTIEEGATVVIASGKNLYVMDGTDDVQSVGTQPDAKADVNGTVNVIGALWTSENNANITSTKKTGSIIYNSAVGNNTKTIKLRKSGTTVTEITMYPAQLHNGVSDPEYTATAGAGANTTFFYCATHDMWESGNSVTVTFDANGGTGSMADQVFCTSGGMLNPNQFTRDGWLFVCWNTERDGTGTGYADEAEVSFSSDTTLYAQWREDVVKYTVAWVDENGNELYSNEYEVDETPVYPGDTPIKEADTEHVYVFAGWLLDGVGELITDNFPPVTGDATYMAVFYSYKIPPVWTWAADYSSATATFICDNGGDDQAVTTEQIGCEATDPGCTTEGATTYTATVTFNGEPYNGSETVVIPAIGHNWGDPSYTWAEDNSSVTATRVCGNNGNHVESETVNTTIVNFDATCETQGHVFYTAEFNNPAFEKQIKTVVIPALGHTASEPVIENSVEATCTDEGSYDTVIYCTVCGEELSRVTTVIPALGHTASEPVIENSVEATCTNEGSYDTVVYCTVCDEELSRVTTVIPALGHTPGEPVIENRVEATCTNEGSYDTVVYCTVCGEELSRVTTVIPALGHEWGEWKLTTAPTCTEAGEETRTCSRCGETETRPVDALGHDWNDPVWTWANDHSAASATFTCENNSTHVETADATITHVDCSEPVVKTVYTATVTFNETQYIDVEEVLYNGWYTDDNGTTYIINGEKAYESGWQTIDGSTYYFNDYYVLEAGVYWLPYPAGYGPDEWNVKNNSPVYQELGYLEDSFFLINEDGSLAAEKNGFLTLDAGTPIHGRNEDSELASDFEVWMVNGEITYHPGLVTDGTDYYYFPTNYFSAGRTKIAGMDYYVSKPNNVAWPEEWGERSFVAGTYTFDENGKIKLYNGLTDIGDKTYYYDHGVKTYAGLILVDGYYYYICSDFTMVKDCTYYISKTNDLAWPEVWGPGCFTPGNYCFAADGHMVLLNGIVEEDADTWYYYEHGIKTYAGLIELDGHLYYVNSNCMVIHGMNYRICKTNGILPQGTYEFDSNGWLVDKDDTLNGIVKQGDQWYYYENGVKTYKGVFKIGEDYYYAKSDGEVIHGKSYYISKTNDLLAKGQYDFDEEGRIFIYDGIYKAENGVWTYYVNGVKTYAGLIKIDGDYYYVTSSFQVVHGRSYAVSKTNDLMPAGTYAFDADGKMIIN